MIRMADDAEPYTEAWNPNMRLSDENLRGRTVVAADGQALGEVGYSGTLGTNYPFMYSVTQNAPSSQAPLVLSNGQTATMENTFATISLSDPTAVNGKGLNLYGRQYNYQTPYVQTFNLTLQPAMQGCSTQAELACIQVMSCNLAFGVDLKWIYNT